MGKSLLQWHPAFQAVIQIELIEDKEYLWFYKEYNLTDNPLRIDTLIIKVEPGRKIKKNIGRIFRQYNVIEYKGPKDYHGCNDFFRVMGYTCILQSNTKGEQAISPEELTITLVGNRYPRKLISFLKRVYHVEMTNPYPGIYYISGLLFPMQIVVQNQLSGSENIWLSRLRQDLKSKEDVEVLAKAYKGKDKDPLYSAAMDLIVRANWEIYKEGNKMCDALNELFAAKMQDKKEEGKIEGRVEGKAEAIVELLAEHGSISENLQKQILSQRDNAVLSKWLKLAAGCSSVEIFMEQMKS